jgi:transcriptional regulator with XRE-family HTH domain
MSGVAKAFGAVVRAEREQRGIAQDAFALLAHVDRSYYGKLERGESSRPWRRSCASRVVCS